MRHVLFRQAGRLFAVRLDGVREVLLPPPLLTRVPRAPAVVRGVMNLRGRVATVVALSRLLELDDAPPADPALSRILLLEAEPRDVGLQVDEVAGIRTLDALAPAPAGARPELLGVARDGDSTATVLSVPALLETLQASFPAARRAGSIA